MFRYEPPVADIIEALEVVGIDELDVDVALVRDLIAGFADFAGDVIGPLDAVGDREGSKHDPKTGAVTTPTGFREAYHQYVSGGWCGINIATEHGGGGFPQVVGTATDEILSSACLSFSLNPLLTRGSIELLSAWGTPQQKEQYLPRLVSGEWTGTMNLTEPDAGSDVGALRTKAEQDADGTWRLTGSKIFITYGEHDLSDNIVHLVLARTPGAPAGTRGISTFIVPKFLDADGPSPKRNTVKCASIEHKLGIHASPTCVLEFDGAVGELVGPENGGMRAMFTMMNAARLGVAVQGIAIGEPSFQQAVAYARERKQGRAADAPAGTSSSIIEHPDVGRMLLDMRSSNRAMRLIVFLLARQTDDAEHHADEATRARAQRAVDLLTPIAKGWCTDTGMRVASTAIQVHGGMGFIEETGIAQRLRDVASPRSTKAPTAFRPSISSPARSRPTRARRWVSWSGPSRRPPRPCGLPVTGPPPLWPRHWMRLSPR